MSEAHPPIRTLFRSNLLTVRDYRCTGYHDGEAEVPQGYEIDLPRAGAYQRRDAHGTFLADPNQITFYNVGQPYDITHPIDGGDASTIFNFAPSLLIEMIRTYDPGVDARPQNIFRRSHITFNSRLQTLQYRLLTAELRTADLLAIEEEIILRTGEIIHALYRDSAVGTRHASQKTLQAHAEQVSLVKVFLNANLHTSLQLEQIASAVHLSPYHLCRIFKQTTGMTLHHYVKRLRLFNAAERILEASGARLDLLALEYGFSNHGNFSTAFRQTFGMNPSELRAADIRRMSKKLKA